MKKRREETRKKRLKVCMTVALLVLLVTVVQLIQCARQGVSCGVWVGGVCINILIYEVLFLASGYIFLHFLSLLSHQKKSELLYGER